MIPLSDMMQLKNKIIKLGILHETGCKWLRRDAGIKEPMDSVALFFLFMLGCYIPSLLLSIIYMVFFKKDSKPTVDPGQYRFNVQD